MSDIYERLTGLFEDVFDDEPEPRPETTAEDVAGCDSFGHTRLMLAGENEFGTRFSTTEVSSLKNNGELFELTERRTA